jgi:WS/DGAT/MGAT family acyltransferase
VAIDSGRIALSPERARALPGSALRAARALAGAGTPARQVRALNAPISPSRHLARVSRPLSDLKRAGRSHGVTVNDVLLSASATGLRHLMERRGESPGPLKAMVPVSLRSGDEAGDLGNRISFVFAELPCHDPDPTRRLARVHDTMRRRKEGREPEGADDLLRLAGLAPRPVQRALSRLVASPLVFNLTVSNVPGPIAPMFMRGCELRAAYPVVPIADHHDLSIGMTTVGDQALVGVYADSRSVPDADHLAADIGQALDELALERDFAVAGV